MQHELAYTSKPHAKSLWSENRIYDDRVELDSRLIRNLVIPMDNITNVQMRPKLVLFDFFRKDTKLEHLPGLKLDLADLSEHVAIEKDTGWIKQLRVTPEDPRGFMEALEKARRKFAARAR